MSVARPSSGDRPFIDRDPGILPTMHARVTTVDNQGELVAALGAPSALPRSIVLIGGADAASADDLESLRAFFATLVQHLDATGTAVVDGGTDSGVMRLIGAARDERGASFRLIGVTPRGALDRPTRDGAPIVLSASHPEILLVPGSQFGDETEYLFGAADHLAAGFAPTLVVNGGRLTLDEARLRMDAGHPVVVVAGSGRAADELAADQDLRASGRLRVVPLSANVEELASAFTVASEEVASEQETGVGAPSDGDSEGGEP